MQIDIESLVPDAKYYRVVLYELCNDGELIEPGTVFGTFLTFREAFDYVGWCMKNDIEEYGRPDVYQILFMDDAGHVLVSVELDDDEIELPCHKPLYPYYGCLGCMKCKEDHPEDEDHADGFSAFEEIITEDDLPF